MSIHRKTDMDRLKHSWELDCGWAVPLARFTAQLSDKDRKRFVRHVFESDEYQLTICNGTWYVEHRSARRQHCEPTARQLYGTGITKTMLRKAGFTI